MSELREKIHPEGPELSRISAGMLRLPVWGYSNRELAKYVESILDQGVTTMDSADIYGDYSSQPRFGEILADKPGLRDKMELVSKCGNCPVSEKKPGHRLKHYDTSAEHIRTSVENSLKNLNSGYLDLLLIHRPSPLMNADETAGALAKLKEEGKIRYAGVSNFTPLQFDLLQSRLDFPLVTNQLQCSVLHTDSLFDGTLDQLQRERVCPMIWSPLAGGELFTSEEKQAVRVRLVLNRLAEKYDCTIDVLALSWILQLPSKPFPVTGTGKIGHIKNAVRAVSIDLERQDWFELLEASRGKPVA